MLCHSNDRTGGCIVKRGAAIAPKGCPSGTEQHGLDCYPKCESGFVRQLNPALARFPDVCVVKGWHVNVSEHAFEQRHCMHGCRASCYNGFSFLCVHCVAS